MINRINKITDRYVKQNTKFGKRICMVLFIMPFMPFIPCLHVLDNGVYYSITIGVDAYIFFINYPWLIQILHASPVYYEDLEDEKYTDHHSRKQHQSVFIFSNQILIAFITSCFVYYYQYKYEHSNLSLFEMAGVLWGIASLMMSVYKFLAKVIKGCISRWKKVKSRKISIDESAIHQLTFSLSDLDRKKSVCVEITKVITV